MATLENMSPTPPPTHNNTTSHQRSTPFTVRSTTSTITFPTTATFSLPMPTSLKPPTSTLGFATMGSPSPPNILPPSPRRLLPSQTPCAPTLNPTSTKRAWQFLQPLLQHRRLTNHSSCLPSTDPFSPLRCHLRLHPSPLGSANNWILRSPSNTPMSPDIHPLASCPSGVHQGTLHTLPRAPPAPIPLHNDRLLTATTHLHLHVVTFLHHRQCLHLHPLP